MELIFNILLVKFGAKPSTFSLGYKTEQLLLNSAEFVNFIASNPDLVMEFLYTEPNPDLVIYNTLFSNLFLDKDLRNTGENNIHYIRGLRLGFPCPDCFNLLRTKNGMNVTMSLIDQNEAGNNQDVVFYYYVDNRDIKAVMRAFYQWNKFQQFANIIGKKIVLKID